MSYAYRCLICLTLTHIIVDASAIVVGPLWGELERVHSLSENALFLVLTIHALASSLAQPVFGYIRDRYPIPSILWIGPVLGAVMMPLVGPAPDVTVLCVALLLGGVGIGSFHPEAAVVAGSLIPERRTRSLSLFMFGGAMGLALGPIACGAIVSTWGLASVWILAPLYAGLILVLHYVGKPPAKLFERDRTKKPQSLYHMLEGKIFWALFLFMVCSLRLVPNMAMDKLISFILKDQNVSAFQIGMVQSVFLFSASAGMLLMAFRFKSGHEKAFMIACPLLGIPLMLALGWEGCPLWLMTLLLVPCGLVLWGTSPAMVSYSHQLFPKGGGVASAITMGMAWGGGGMIQAKITSHFVALGKPQLAFYAIIPCLLLAAVGATLLPALSKQPQPQSEALETA
ncbi:MFS transporter [Gimesia panareensis]|uniref:MFS transporter n=1 Tax=Gimesia panareensis TaxID=2527978 RepID=UPI00118B8647|nr:MFS transporter [Gimesia panareensis]QDU50030.1 Fosmidomycin resistance protein [Gimesia panareensis]